MKKIICILLALILSLSLCLISCENKPASDKDDTKDSTNPTQGSTEKTTEPDTTEEPVEPNIPEEIDIDAAKKYLEDNYDKMNIDGSTSMIPLHQSLNDLFSSNPDVYHSKTVEAFEKLISGENDILLGVDYSDELIKKSKENGVELVKRAITREAFVFLKNINNPVESLTIEQIKDIYSGKITNWSEVGGDNEPIRAFQRNSDSGSQIRMVKFMGDTKLIEEGVEYFSAMGTIVEQIANYDEGKYSIAYNMYTFTEKQYLNQDVVLLAVNSVAPTDETIFDETYPVVIYNYIYYDANNAQASGFAQNLYAYLMSSEGQKLISDSGYVNLNEKLDRNKDAYSLYDDIPYYDDHENNKYIDYYNKEKGEYYAVDWNTNELLTFTNYADFILRDSEEYKNNANAREFLETLADSDMVFGPYSAGLVFGEEITSVYIYLNPWAGGGVFDPEHFFSFKYNDIYYSDFKYYIDEDKYVLTAKDQETVELYFDVAYMASEYLAGFEKYVNEYIPGATVELTREDLKNLYMRTLDYDFMTENGSVELKYFKPFE